VDPVDGLDLFKEVQGTKTGHVAQEKKNQQSQTKPLRLTDSLQSLSLSLCTNPITEHAIQKESEEKDQFLEHGF
jgi:hypothetical protein